MKQTREQKDVMAKLRAGHKVLHTSFYGSGLLGPFQEGNCYLVSPDGESELVSPLVLRPLLEKGVIEIEENGKYERVYRLKL